jgi:hypothetical protein
MQRTQIGYKEFSEGEKEERLIKHMKRLSGERKSRKLRASQKRSKDKLKALSPHDETLLVRLRLTPRRNSVTNALLRAYSWVQAHRR